MLKLSKSPIQYINIFVIIWRFGAEPDSLSDFNYNFYKITVFVYNERLNWFKETFSDCTRTH